MSSPTLGSAQESLANVQPWLDGVAVDCYPESKDYMALRAQFALVHATMAAARAQDRANEIAHTANLIAYWGHPRFKDANRVAPNVIRVADEVIQERLGIEAFTG